MNNKDLQNYKEYKVSNVKAIKGKFGFIITLIYENGETKIIQSSGFKTKKIANGERDKTLGELVTRTFVVDNTLKLGDFLDDWLENIMRIKITYNTYNSYKNAIKHINNAIGKTNLLILKTSTISRLYQEHAKKSLSVAKIMRVVLKTSLDYAVRKKIIKENPAINAVFPKKSKALNLGFRTRQINVKNTLTEEQLMYLITSSKETSIYLHILFATLLGLRKSEINGLKYTDIDYVNKTISVQRQIGKKLTKPNEPLGTSTKDELDTKTSSSNRVLQLPDLLFEEILKQHQWYERQKKRRKSSFYDDKFICCCYNGKPRSRGYVYKPFKKLLKDCGLPDIRWHDLRASYCTMLLKENFSPKAVSTLMGHAKEIITVDVYGDNKVIGDCIEELEPVIRELLPQKDKMNIVENCNLTIKYSKDIQEMFMEELINNLMSNIGIS